LDAELRVVTPVDAASVREGGTTAGKPELKQYQLTHDYLISDLRAWLTSEQRGTLRGRAQLRLEEISDLWRSTTQGRYLPGLGDYAFCRLFTSAKRWTPAQRDIMTAARNRHMMRLAVLLVCATALVWWSTRWRGRIEAQGIVRGILNADLPQVERQYTDSALRLSNWTRPLLAEEYVRAGHDGGDALRPALMLVRLVPDDTQYREYLFERLLTAHAAEIGVICQAIEPYKVEFVDRLWSELQQAGIDDGSRRLRVASALANFAPDDPRWIPYAHTLVRDLTTLPSATSLKEWMSNLLPARESTLALLVNLVTDPKVSSAQRFRATDILADFASDRPTLLAESIRFCSDDVQYEFLFSVLSAHGPAAVKAIDERWTETVELDRRRQDRVAGIVNLAVVLLRLGADQRAWDLLGTQTDNLTQVSQLIHLIARRKCDSQLVAQRLRKSFENNETLLASRLALALGEFSNDERKLRSRLLPELFRMYQDRQQPAELHAALEWLLNRWQQQDRIEEILPQLALSGEIPDNVGWYVNGQQQTMVILQAESFDMGSPAEEEGHDPDERQRTVQIHRRFAIGSHPVTKRQFLKAFPEFTAEDFDKTSPEDDCPVNSVTWFDAVRYCNWLSQQEGIPEREWCFEPNSDGVFAAGMRLKPGYLSLSGYRLGTEAEWEFACRAGTTTARYYGDDPDLLDKYIWCSPNSSGRMWPVGTLKPNGFGLFDMLGNSWDWVLNRDLYETQEGLLQNDVEDHQLEIVELGDDQKPITRVRKGASFNSAASSHRPANRAPRSPSQINNINSFRLVRTLPRREESPRD
jgi:formylglycine-generating enzyme required for sulfatase activity